MAAFAAAAIVLVVAGKDPLATYARLLDRAFIAPGALSSTFVTATPLLFTGLAAAAAFRMRLWNIGGEGQLYLGAIGASGVGLVLRDQTAAVIIAGMIGGGLVAGAAWAIIPGLLKAYFNTNEIITTLMLNYVAGLLLTYLIFDSQSFWRDLSTFSARAFPQGKPLPDAAAWPTFDAGLAHVPFGFLVGLLAASGLWLLYGSTSFGFQARVLGDSPSAARYAGIKTRRIVVAMMALSDLWPASAARARSVTFGTCSTRAGCSRPASVTRASSWRLWLGTTRLPWRWLPSCWAAWPTPATACRARTFRPGSSACCRE